jgi:hypothetical protein
MKNRLEDLWKSADDGASTPVGPLTIRPEAEFDELLDAWYIERQNSIEFEILLDQSCKLIKQLLSDGDVSDSERRRARRLIQAINRSLKTAHADEG